MHINFDFTISGCREKCKYCALDSRDKTDASLVSVSDIVNSLSALISFDKENDYSISLFNEVLGYDEIVSLLRTIDSSELKNHVIKELSFTSDELLLRDDKSEVIASIKEHNYSAVVSLLSYGEGYDKAIGHDCAYDSVLNTIALLSENEIPVKVNLLATKLLKSSVSSIMSDLSKYKNISVVVSVPEYIPNDKMRRGHKIFMDYFEAQNLNDELKKYGIDTKMIQESFKHSENAVLEDLYFNKWNLQEELLKYNNEKYFSIDSQGCLYFGRLSARTEKIGQIKDIDTVKLKEIIRAHSENKVYTSYYEIGSFENIRENMMALASKRTNFIYRTHAECIYRLIDELWFDTKIINPLKK